MERAPAVFPASAAGLVGPRYSKMKGHLPVNFIQSNIVFAYRAADANLLGRGARCDSRESKKRFN
jgi:hypothetical protein